MSESAPPPESPSPKWHRYLLWPGLIIGLLVGQIVLLLVMVYIATSDQSFSVEPDYYQKGLNWDVTAEQLRANKRLAWLVTIDLGLEVSILNERTVRLTLTTPQGDVLDGADVRVTAFPIARGEQRIETALEPVGGGVYESKLRFSRDGLWEFRVVVERGPETFTHVERRDVYPPGESRPWRP